VDEQLLDIINILFNNGYETENSCQANIQSKAWIPFSSHLDAKRLVNESQMNREFLQYLTAGEGVEWSVHFDTGHLDDSDDDDDGEDRDVVMSMSLRFPKQDIPMVTTMLRHQYWHPDDETVSRSDKKSTS